MCICQTAQQRAGCSTRSGFKRTIASFPYPRQVAKPRLKEPNLPYYLPKAGERIDWFLPFSGELMPIKTQTALYNVRTQITNSIYYDNNHYANLMIFSILKI